MTEATLYKIMLVVLLFGRSEKEALERIRKGGSGLLP